MATLPQARERIYQEFTTAWGATSAFVLDNEKMVPPAGDKWVRVAVRHQASVQETLGGVGLRKFERIGTVFVQCFTPLDKGMADGDNLAQAARAVFEGKTLNPEAIHFFGVAVRDIGVSESWNQTNVEAFFIYHETK